MRIRGILLMSLWLGLILPKARATDYYFSSSAGNDSFDGTDAEAPFASIQKASALHLKPGDRLLFKSGDLFMGMLHLDASGKENSPIVVGRYGTGPCPVLDGMGEEAAIRMHNNSFVTIEHLRITNWEGPYGIYFTGEDAGELKEVVFQDLDISRVGHESTTISDPSKSIGGLCGRIRRGKIPTWWNGLTIRNLYVHNAGSCGITLGGDVNLYKIDRDDPYFKPHQNVVIEQCRIDSIVRDGIWIRQCEGAIIQHCEVSRTGMNAISNGIWFWDCLNCIMQFNEGWECGSPRGNDGAPFSIDNHCLDCIIQYNYSHDNEGPGYMIFGREGDGTHNVVRKNLSYNDNVTRTYKSGTASITLASEVKDARVEENVIIAGAETHYILGHRNWEGYPVSVIYRNNLFVGNHHAVIAETEEVVRAGTFEGNMFINVPHLPPELEGQQDPAAFFKLMMELNEPGLRNLKGLKGKPFTVSEQ